MAASSRPLPSTTSNAVLTAATKALEASTSSLVHNIECLQAQRNLLGRHRGHAAVILAEKEAFRERKRQRQEAEIEVLQREIEPIFHQLEGQLSDRQKHLDQTLRAIPAQVNERLMVDDAILAQLETDRSTSDPTDQRPIQLPELEEIQDLTNLLTSLTVEELQNRLDLVYLTHLSDDDTVIDALDAHEPVAQTNNDNDDDDDDDDTASKILAGFKADINSLYPDIHDVASMCLSQKYVHAYTQLKQQIQEIKTTAQEDEWTNTLQHLDHMTTSLTTLTDDIRTLHSHQALTADLQATLTGLQGEYTAVLRQRVTPLQSKQQQQQQQPSSTTRNLTQYPATNTPLLTQYSATDTPLLTQPPPSSTLDLTRYPALTTLLKTHLDVPITSTLSSETQISLQSKLLAQNSLLHDALTETTAITTTTIIHNNNEPYMSMRQAISTHRAALSTVLDVAAVTNSVDVDIGRHDDENDDVDISRHDDEYDDDDEDESTDCPPATSDKSRLEADQDLDTLMARLRDRMEMIQGRLAR